jgi:hypothetical protein
MRAAGLLLAAGLLAGCRAQADAALSQSPGRAQVLAAADGLADGDLVFRRGRDVLSAMVLGSGGGSRFSHVGVVVRDGAQVDVIHAMPDEPGVAGGVRRESLQAFLALPVASDAASRRAPGLDAGQRARIHAYLTARIGTPFDMAFELGDDQRLYCSELALRALAQAGVQLAPATVRVPMLREPVIAPDGLQQADGLQALAGS